MTMIRPAYSFKLRRKRSGMPKGFKFPIVICEKCGRPVARNWIVRHLKAGCQGGVQIAPVDPAEFLHVPFKCPECEARLLVEIDEWETDTGLITEAGFHLQCPNESHEDRDTWHRHYQGEWQPTITKVYRWLSANVRVWRQDR